MAYLTSLLEITVASAVEPLGKDPNFFHPGSRVKKIPDPGSGSASRNLNKCLSSRKYDPGCSIPDPDPDYF